MFLCRLARQHAGVRVFEVNRTNQTGGCKLRILQVKNPGFLLVSGARLLKASHSAKMTDEGLVAGRRGVSVSSEKWFFGDYF